ncbi:MAG: ATP-dependent DNA helicase RecG [Ruminococcus sp.]|nr:ATP-dependent DNA helicase RecG [Ruminococcus sp.]
MNSELDKPITYLKGVGPKRAELYAKMGVFTVYDLLCHYPRSYIDLNTVTPLSDSVTGEQTVVRVTVVKKLPEARIRKGLSVFKAVVTDGTADLTVVIYNSSFLFAQLELDKEYYLIGRITGTLIRREMNSPLVFKADTDCKVQPVYRLTEGISQNVLRGNMKNALAACGKYIYEPLPQWVKTQYQLCAEEYAMNNIHFPKDTIGYETAKKRLVFDELLVLQLGMSLIRTKSRQYASFSLKNISMQTFFESLPFELTACQKKAALDCAEDMQKQFPMNRLVQGDVGSGKTAVAAAAAYFACKNGCQTALMAPTEVLAAQHYDTLKSFLEPLGIKVALLTGALTQKQKNAVREGAQNGDFDVVVGTHTLFQNSTGFKKLALVITDEQHRFGVRQRATLAQKGGAPHKLVMSATPIPRTLAMMIYGDLDISVLDELPKGRQPVKTYAVTGKLRERAFAYVKKHLEQGRQGYVVCPMIDESDMELADVKSYAKKLKEGALKDYRIGLLHGKLASDKKEKIMADFKAHKLDLLVSTTVIEVGVDVPNATIMVIENADRFGLSQLHQLRGRVGRGSFESDCVLITDNVSETTVKRLKILSSTTDGFKISEEDLKLRGPGDFFGDRQHGLPKLRIADMSQDMDVLKKARHAAEMITQQDPLLENAENKGLKELVDKLFEEGLTDN